MWREKWMTMFIEDHGAVAFRELNRLYWKAIVARMVGFMACAASAALLWLVLIHVTNNLNPESFLYGLCAFGMLIAVAGTLIFLIYGVLTPPYYRTFWRDKDLVLEDTREGWRFFKFGNPVVVIPFVIYVSISYLWRNRRFVCRVGR